MKYDITRWGVSQIKVSAAGELILVIDGRTCNMKVQWESITVLHVQHNELSYLPPLPRGLIELNCRGNKLPELPELPDCLRVLDCEDNLLTYLPKLSVSLILLVCNNNKLTYLPELPSTLEDLRCGNNLLTYLPALSNVLDVLVCPNNKLTCIPAPLPGSLTWLTCSDNQLVSLPRIPDTIEGGYFENNPFDKGVNRAYIPPKMRCRLPQHAFDTYRRLAVIAIFATELECDFPVLEALFA